MKKIFRVENIPCLGNLLKHSLITNREQKSESNKFVKYGRWRLDLVLLRRRKIDQVHRFIFSILFKEMSPQFIFKAVPAKTKKGIFEYRSVIGIFFFFLKSVPELCDVINERYRSLLNAFNKFSLELYTATDLFFLFHELKNSPNLYKFKFAIRKRHYSSWSVCDLQ